jgi:mono/diheme cytochrome c family protein
VRSSSLIDRRALRLVLGAALATVALEAGGAALALVLGLVPIGADSTPSAWEVRFFGLARRAALVRRVEAESPASGPADPAAGVAIYADLCVRCHGWPGARVPSLGRSLYPPAPPLYPLRASSAEVFWIVKHGVRHTGMPAWGALLSDQDVFDVAVALTGLGALPPEAAAAELSRLQAAGAEGEDPAQAREEP